MSEFDQEITIVSIGTDAESNNRLQRVIAYIGISMGKVRMVAQFTAGAEAIQKCPLLVPHLIIIDASLLDMRIADLVQALKMHCPTSQFLFSTIGDVAFMQEMYLLGESGFLFKPYDAEHMFREIMGVWRRGQMKS